MERKGQKNTRRQRRSRSWLFSPVIIAQLAVVMVIAGVGVAFALPQNNVGNNAPPWAGTGTVAQTAHYTVTGYTLTYDSTLTQITGVTLSVTNSSGIGAHVTVVAINGSSAVKATSSSTVVTTPTTPVTFTAQNLSDVDKINVLLTEP